MKIYSTSNTEGSLFFWTLKEARADAIKSAKSGRHTEIALNVVGRLSKELFMAAIRGGGWADEVRSLEEYEPVGEADAADIFKIKRIVKLKAKK